MHIDAASTRLDLVESPSYVAEPLASLNSAADSLPDAPQRKKTSLRALPKVGGEEVISAKGSRGTRQKKESSFLSKRASNNLLANVSETKVLESKVSESENASLSQYDQALAQNQIGRLSRNSSVSSFHSREDEDEDLEEDTWSWNFGCIHPESPMHITWWYFIMFIALACAIIEPFNVSFLNNPGFYPYNNVFAIFYILSTVFFIADTGFKLRVAYYDEDGQLVFDSKEVAKRYFRKMFWWDLLFAIPFDGIVLESLGGPNALEKNTVLYIELLRFLRLGRLYNLFDFFATVDHKMILSQFSLIVLRNNTYIFFSCHWFACIIYFIARIELNDYGNSWIGRHMDRIEGQPEYVKYIYSLYYSVTAFTSVGDGDWYAASYPEAIVMILFLVYTLVVSAYILGTITMLVVKSDEHSNKFRDRVTHMREFSRINKVPNHLVAAMHNHLELYFAQNHMSDSKVLGMYPIAIKRKVLRFLYMKTIKDCYLLKNARTKFLDALVSLSSIELFSSNVQLVHQGDLVSSLNIIVEGVVQVITKESKTSFSRSMVVGAKSMRRESGPGGADSMTSQKSSMYGKSNLTSMRSSGNSQAGESEEGCNDFRSVSETYSEVAFFTENPSDESVITCGVVKVLCLSKEDWDRLSHDFPVMNHLILNNLMHRISKGLLRSMFEAVMSTPVASDRTRDRIAVLMNAEEEQEEALDLNGLERDLVKDVKALMSPEKKIKFNRDLEVANHVQQYMKKHVEGQTNALMIACRLGDTDGIKRLIEQKVNPNCMDHDLRTGLMIAAAHGHAECLQQMMTAGADPNLLDAVGCSALWEAVDKGRNASAVVLRKNGAGLCLTPALETHALFQCVATGNKEKLEGYLRMGANPNVANVDGRTALHMACRGGQQQMELVDVLLHYGAQPSTRDKFGLTPLLEAVEKSHLHVLDSLLNKDASLNLEPSMELRHMMHIINTADNARLRMFLRAGANPNICNCIGRTPMHVAARMGNIQAVKELVEYGADIHQEDESGVEPIGDAQQVGASQVVEYLEAEPKACAEKKKMRLSAVARSVMLARKVAGSFPSRNPSLANLPSVFDVTNVFSLGPLPEDEINDELEREMSGLTQGLSELKPRPPSNASTPRGEIQTSEMSNRAEYQGRRRSTVSFHGLKVGMDAAAAGQDAGSHLALVTSGSLPAWGGAAALPSQASTASHKSDSDLMRSSLPAWGGAAALPARDSTASRESVTDISRSSRAGGAALPARGGTASRESGTNLTRSSPGGAAASPVRGSTPSRESETDLMRDSRAVGAALPVGGRSASRESETDLMRGSRESDTDFTRDFHNSETDFTRGSCESDTDLTPRQGITDFLESALSNIQLRNTASDHAVTSPSMNEAPPGRGPLSKLIGSPSVPVESPRTESSLEGVQWRNSAAYESVTKPEGAEEAAAGTTVEVTPARAKLEGVEGAVP